MPSILDKVYQPRIGAMDVIIRVTDEERLEFRSDADALNAVRKIFVDEISKPHTKQIHASCRRRWAAFPGRKR